MFGSAKRPDTRTNLSRLNRIYLQPWKYICHQPEYFHLLSSQMWGCTPAWLPALVGRHHGVPTWMSEVCLTWLIQKEIAIFIKYAGIYFLPSRSLFFLRLLWPHRLRLSQHDRPPRAPLPARGHRCYQEQHLVVMGTGARGGLPSVLLCHRGLRVRLWPTASSCI